MKHFFLIMTYHNSLWENPSEFHEESRSVMVCIITFQRDQWCVTQLYTIYKLQALGTEDENYGVPWLKSRSQHNGKLKKGLTTIYDQIQISSYISYVNRFLYIYIDLSKPSSCPYCHIIYPTDWQKD